MISVVIPVFNRPQGAHRAIRSVLGQRGLAALDLEIVVVDDCSDPPLVLTGTDHRVRLVRLDWNAGAAGARNAGIRAATGEFIAFLDSDDVWLPDKLAGQMRTLQAAEEEEKQGGNSAPLAVVCGFYCPDRRTGRLQSRMPVPAASPAQFASGCWYNPGSALLLRRSTYDRVGLLDEQLRRLEDLDWFLRFGLAGGHLLVAPVIGSIVAPSNSGAAQVIIASTKRIKAKYRPGGPMELTPRGWRWLQAYLSLERGAALRASGKMLAAGMQMVTSFALKPRLQASVVNFWVRSDDVPSEIAEIYAAMSIPEPARSHAF